MGPKKLPYVDYDWDELPDVAKKAAAVLGYNKQTWDDDEESEFDDYSWKELNQEQQQAAAILGYDEKSWNSSS
ncbi:hypothetical protein ACA910_000500 [Epithemia clementina (nom. ined.)]